jgi:uncharacterized protein
MSNIGTTPAIYSARPQLKVDGESRLLLGENSTVVVEETTEGLYRCEMTLVNLAAPAGGGLPDYAFLDRADFDFGTEIQLSAGAGETEGVLFDGRVMALEAHYPHVGQPLITVLAEDRLQDLRLTRRTRTFEAVTVPDIVNQIANDHGLTASVDLPDAPSNAIVAQVNQSDLAFLRDCVHAVDGEVWVEEDTLFAERRGDRRAGSVDLKYKQGLREFSVLADLAHQSTEYVVSGWDVQSKTQISGLAQANAIGSETNGGISGPAVLSRMLRDQGGDATRVQQRVDTVPLTSDEAQVHAEAAFRQQARRFVTGRGVAIGNARIHVGTRLNLDGLGQMFNGEYTTVAVRHTFDNQTGFRTQFDVQRPAIDTE